MFHLKFFQVLGTDCLLTLNDFFPSLEFGGGPCRRDFAPSCTTLHWIALSCTTHLLNNLSPQDPLLELCCCLLPLLSADVAPCFSAVFCNCNCFQLLFIATLCWCFSLLVDALCGWISAVALSPSGAAAALCCCFFCCASDAATALCCLLLPLLLLSGGCSLVLQPLHSAAPAVACGALSQC